MNRNKKVLKVTTYALAASVMIGSSALTASASATAGITNAVATTQSLTEAGHAASTAGISRTVTAIVASAKTEAEGTVAKAETETVTTARPVEEAIDEAPVSEYANVGIATVEDFVYVRDSASEEGSVIGKLYAKNACTVNGEENGWYQITSGNLNGYVSSEYVSVGDEALIAESSRRIATVTADILYVRAETSGESAIVDYVGQTEDLTVIDETTAEQGWVRVSVNGEEGYVSTEFVELSTLYTYGETAEEETARLEAERQAALAAQEAAERQQAAARAQQQSASSSAKSSSSSQSLSSYAPPASATGQAVANYACQFIGNPYVYGGSSLTNGTDCSGFVMSVYAQFGVSLPHSSSADRSVGYGVSYDQMAPGDIVCYSGHVGIYVGGGTIVNASTPATGIKYSNVNYAPILAIRRIF